jgi:hypothetical protein
VSLSSVIEPARVRFAIDRQIDIGQPCAVTMVRNHCATGIKPD